MPTPDQQNNGNIAPPSAAEAPPAAHNDPEEILKLRKVAELALELINSPHNNLGACQPLRQALAEAGYPAKPPS